MKRVLLCVALILLVSVPAAFSQIRIETGINGNLATGNFAGSEKFPEYGDDFDKGLIPVTNVGLFYQFNLGALKLDLGGKIQNFTASVVAYPAVQAELALGRFSIDASVGGYYFAYYVPGNEKPIGVKQDNILLPDVSVWLGLGKYRAFRIGGGVIAAVPTDFAFEEVPYVVYAGMKIVL